MNPLIDWMRRPGRTGPELHLPLRHDGACAPRGYTPAGPQLPGAVRAPDSAGPKSSYTEGCRFFSEFQSA